MIVIFEGPDGAGKDFLRREFEKSTNFKHTVVTRFMLSQLVFARYYKRPEWVNLRLQNESLLNLSRFIVYFRPLIVYCHAITPVLHERIRRRGEHVADQPDLDRIKDYYEILIDSPVLKNRTLKLDTSYDPPLDDLVSRVVGKIKSLEGRR